MQDNGRSVSIPQVAILLCTKNGQRFLEAQLDSINKQTYPYWKLWVSDDGSQDDTIAILEDFQTLCGNDRVLICDGPRKGFAANFLSLTCRNDIKAEFYAYADQDDVWEAEKLAGALQWLEKIPCNLPGLYCSRTRLIDEKGNDIGLSPNFRKPPCFANALVQSIAGGNTMVFNNAARLLLREAGPNLDIVSHDWWTYLLVSGCGGKVFFDPRPTICYRQHSGNFVGSNRKLTGRLARMSMLLGGGFRDWNTRNLTSLCGFASRLTRENRHIFEQFMISRDQPFFSRLLKFRSSGVCRQSVLGNLVLFAAAAFKKL
ncbi:MAG: glycosyltransferase family 2 protein [Proteobacteria bacterium]|nr:glycosyltransferase family 2 protein [Pseudomonadota bacterium]MBU4295741.1 glycosyltransferase family 2 protein [Pseudomonadota bacterium]MCG2747160.1 glycosyltransferase family 2 protein [Desulfobulbaceae bacterium]